MSKSGCAVLVLTLVSVLPSRPSAAQEAKPKNAGAQAARLAFITRQPTPAILNVLDLASADLSKDRRVELVERLEIDRLLKEQKLSLAGVVDASAAVRAGQVLGADLLALLETDPGGKEAIGLVVYDAASGVKYVDQGLPSGLAAAATVAELSRDAVRKRDQGVRAFKLVSVLAVRNADLSRDKDLVCQSLARLLERALGNSPGIALLERQRLEALQREKKLAADASAEQLLNALYTLDLEFGRGKDGRGLRALAWLTDGKGNKLDSLRVDGTDKGGSDLPEELAALIRRQLQVAGEPKAVDRAVEAKRYLGEAGLLWSFQQPRPALAALEAAIALAPDNLAAKVQRVEYHSFHAYGLLTRELAKPAKTGALLIVKPEVAQDILDHQRLALEHHLELLAELGPSQAAARGVVPLIERQRHGLTMPATYLLEGSKQSQEWVEQRERNQATHLELMHRQLRLLAEVALRDPGLISMYFNFHHHHFSFFLGVGQPAQTKAAQQSLRKASLEWVELTRQPKILDYLQQPLMLGQYDLWRLHMDQQGEEVLAALIDHPHPWLALDGKVYLARAKVGGLKASQAERDQAFFEAKKAYQDTLARSATIKDPAQRDALKARVYQSWKDTTARWGLLETKFVAETNFVCHLMLDNKDLNPDVLHWLLPKTGYWGPTRPENWRLVGKALDVVDASPRKKEPALRELRKTLLSYRDELLKLEPKLAALDPALAAIDPFAEQPPPFQANLLFHVRDHKDLKTLRFPFTHDGALYCLALAGQGNIHREVFNPAVQLVRMPRNAGTHGQDKAALLSRVPITLAKQPGAPHGALQSYCAGDDVVYVGTHQDGIVVLPFSKEGGRKLDVDLPSQRVLKMAFLNGKIYAHLDDGFLVAIDPRSKDVDVLASSRRRESRSPFDDAETFQIPFLSVDPPRDRLLFVVLQPGKIGGGGPSKNLNGLWEYQVKTGKYQQLLAGVPHLGPQSEATVLRFGYVQTDGKLLLGTFGAALEFDPADNKARLLRCAGPTPVPALRAEIAPTRGGLSQFGVAKVLHNNWLWSVGGAGLDRLSLNGRLERFPTLAKDVPRLWAAEAAYLEMIGPNEMLVGGGEGFALCTLTKEPNPLVKGPVEEKGQVAVAPALLAMDRTKDGLVAVIDGKGKIVLGQAQVAKWRTLDGPALALAFAPDGKRLAWADNTAMISMRDIDASQAQWTVPSGLRRVSHLAWNGTGDKLIAAGPEGWRILQAADGKIIHQTELDGLTHLVAIPGSNNILTVQEDKISKRWLMHLWNLEQPTSKRPLVDQLAPIQTLAVSPKGQVVAWSSLSQAVPFVGAPQIQALELSSGRILHKVHGGVTWEAFTNLAWAADERTLAAAMGNRLWLWDLPQEELLVEHRVGAASLRGLHFAGAENALITAGSDGVLRWLEIGMEKE